MGVYSLNRTNLNNNVAVPESEPYFGFVGCYEAMIDMEHNNHVIFEALIQNDFKEAAYVNEGNLEQAQIVNEASIAGIKEGIMKFLRKVWAKINGILDSFKAKINSVIMRDNVAFVKKYEKDVRKKDLSKLKYKYSEPKEGISKLADCIEKPDQSQFKALADEAFRYVTTSNVKNLENMQDKRDADFIIKRVLGTDEVKNKSFAKDIHEFCYAKAEECTGLKDDGLRKIISLLTNKEAQIGKKSTSIEKIQQGTNKYFQSLISDLEKATKAADKLDPDDKGKWDYEYENNGKKVDIHMSKGAASKEYGKRASLGQNLIVKTEEMHNKFVTAYLKEYKFMLDQCRSIFSKAVTYKPKKSANASFEFEDEYLNAVAEAAEYDMELMFESEVMVTEE